MQNEVKNLESLIFFKKRTRKDFLHDGSWFVYPWTMQKCKKPHSYVILVSKLMWNSSEKKPIWIATKVTIQGEIWFSMPSSKITPLVNTTFSLYHTICFITNCKKPGSIATKVNMRGEIWFSNRHQKSLP